MCSDTHGKDKPVSIMRASHLLTEIQLPKYFGITYASDNMLCRYSDLTIFQTRKRVSYIGVWILTPLSTVPPVSVTWRCLERDSVLAIFGLQIFGSLTIRTKKDRLQASVSFFFRSNISNTSSAGSCNKNDHNFRQNSRIIGEDVHAFLLFLVSYFCLIFYEQNFRCSHCARKHISRISLDHMDVHVWTSFVWLFADFLVHQYIGR